MGNLVLLIFCFGAGITLHRMHRLPENASAVLNGFIINIGLPALALAYLRDISISRDLALVAAAPWIMFILGGVVFWLVGRVMNLPRPTTGCLILVGGLANTSFVGIPMIEAFYGLEWISVGVVADQLGSYLVLSLLGIGIARVFAAGPRPTAREVIYRVIQFPPFVATVAALLLLPVSYPEWLIVLLERLAATVAPLALFSIGFQLRLSEVSGRIGPLALGLIYKLVLGPLLVLFILVTVFDMRGTIAQITVFEVAMAPMVGASIVAMENDLDPQLATLLVGLGVPLSFVTLAVWYQVLGGL